MHWILDCHCTTSDWLVCALHPENTSGAQSVIILHPSVCDMTCQDQAGEEWSPSTPYIHRCKEPASAVYAAPDPRTHFCMEALPIKETFFTLEERTSFASCIIFPRPRSIRSGTAIVWASASQWTAVLVLHHGGCSKLLSYFSSNTGLRQLQYIQTGLCGMICWVCFWSTFPSSK